MLEMNDMYNSMQMLILVKSYRVFDMSRTAFKFVARLCGQVKTLPYNHFSQWLGQDVAYQYCLFIVPSKYLQILYNIPYSSEQAHRHLLHLLLGCRLRLASFFSVTCKVTLKPVPLSTQKMG